MIRQARPVILSHSLSPSLQISTPFFSACFLALLFFLVSIRGLVPPSLPVPGKGGKDILVCPDDLDSDNCCSSAAPYEQSISYDAPEYDGMDADSDGCCASLPRPGCMLPNQSCPSLGAPRRLTVNMSVTVTVWFEVDDPPGVRRAAGPRDPPPGLAAAQRLSE